MLIFTIQYQYFSWSHWGKKLLWERKWQRKKYRVAQLSKKYITMVLLHASKQVLESDVTMITLFFAYFFADFGQPDLSQVSKTIPCTNTMQKINLEATADIFILEEDSINSLPFIMLLDKVDRHHYHDWENVWSSLVSILTKDKKWKWHVL